MSLPYVPPVILKLAFVAIALVTVHTQRKNHQLEKELEECRAINGE